MRIIAVIMCAGLLAACEGQTPLMDRAENLEPAPTTGVAVGGTVGAVAGGLPGAALGGAAGYAAGEVVQEATQPDYDDRIFD